VTPIYPERKGPYVTDAITVEDARQRIAVRVEGRHVTATLVGVDGGKARVQYPNGSRATVALARLRRV
jgi:hypothetical protein